MIQTHNKRVQEKGPKLIIKESVEDLNKPESINTGSRQGTLFTGFYADNNEFSAQAFGANIKLCSNEPLETYREDFARNCNEINSPSFNTRFWVYAEYHGTVHETSPAYNFYVRGDALDPNGFNVGQVKGALANAEIAARPEYIDEVIAVSKDIITTVDHTDADIFLRNGKIIEAKNSQIIAAMTKNSDDYKKFTNKVRLLIRYQNENNITSGVEIVAKGGISPDALSYLQRLNDSGFNITWRVI